VPGGREPGGKVPGGREPRGKEPGGKVPGGREPRGKREPAGGPQNPALCCDIGGAPLNRAVKE